MNPFADDFALEQQRRSIAQTSCHAQAPEVEAGGSPKPEPVPGPDSALEPTGFSLVLEAYHTRTDAQVVVPEGVTQILPRAFAGHHEITSVVLPESLQSIGSHAFSGCSGLREVRVPEAVFEVGSHAFAGCRALERVELPAGLLRVADSAFAQCTRLREVSGGAEVAFIEDGAFSGCGYMESLTLLEQATRVGSEAFAGCVRLREALLPPVMDSMGAGAFRGCSQLSRVRMPSEVRELGKSLFVGCSRLQDIEGAEALASRFPDAFPRGVVEAQGLIRPQDVRTKRAAYVQAHAEERAQLEAALDARRAELAALLQEERGLGLLDRARKKQLEGAITEKRCQMRTLKCRIGQLENPALEALASPLE